MIGHRDVAKLLVLVVIGVLLIAFWVELVTVLESVLA